MRMAYSGHFRRPAFLAHHVICPALAAAGEVLAVGDQPLVQLAGENRANESVALEFLPKTAAELNGSGVGSRW